MKSLRRFSALTALLACSALACEGEMRGQDTPLDASPDTVRPRSDARLDVPAERPDDHATDPLGDPVPDQPTDPSLDPLPDQPQDPSLDPSLDPLPDRVEEEPPPLSPFGCVDGWPAYEPPAPVPSLNRPPMMLLTAHTVQSTTPWPGTYVPGATAVWAGRMGFSTGTLAVSYDPATNTSVTSHDNFLPYVYQGVPVYATIRTGLPGAFVFAGYGVSGRTRDFLNETGAIWGASLGPMVGEHDPMRTDVHPMLLDPQGRVYVSVFDEPHVLVIEGGGGDLLATIAVTRTEYHRTPHPTAGVGNRFFVEHGASYDRESYQGYEPPQYDEQAVAIIGAMYSRKLLGHTGSKRLGTQRLVAVDPCGEPLWSVGHAVDSFLVGFDDMLITATTAGNSFMLSVNAYSKDGSRVAGPVRHAGRPIALGADGVSYYLRCSGESPSWDSPLEVVARNADLTERAVVHVGGKCLVTDGVLLDDGTLLIPQLTAFEQELRIVRIATSSPGPAKTAWPLSQRDHYRSGWLTAW